MTIPLEIVTKIAVLSAVVESDFDLVTAASALEIDRATIFRMFVRWEIETPLGDRHPGRVKYSDYVKRCNAIRLILKNLTASTDAEVTTEDVTELRV